MTKTFNKGGQRRTMESSCGWRCVGHPTEVNKKYELHKKYCKECGGVNYTPEKFNHNGALMNGWKGQFHHTNTKKETLSTVIVNGTATSIHMKGVKRTELTEKLNEKILTDDELVALFSK